MLVLNSVSTTYEYVLSANQIIFCACFTCLLTDNLEVPFFFFFQFSWRMSEQAICSIATSRFCGFASENLELSLLCIMRLFESMAKLSATWLAWILSV